MEKTEKDEKESKLSMEAHDIVDKILVSANAYITKNKLNDPSMEIFKQYKEFQTRCVRPVTFATQANRDKIIMDLKTWCEKNNIPIDENAEEMPSIILSRSGEGLLDKIAFNRYGTQAATAADATSLSKANQFMTPSKFTFINGNVMAPPVNPQQTQASSSSSSSIPNPPFISPLLLQ